MKKLRKLLSAVIAVICIASCAIITSSAASYNKASLVSYLTKEFESRTSQIDISSYKIPRAQYSEIYDLIENEIPTIFCTSKYTIYSQGDVCKYIKATYIDKAEYSNLLNKFNKNTEYLLRGLKTNKLSDKDKILLVHDRLIAWCEYDYVNYEKDTITKDDSRAVGVIVNRTAVCSGYTRAFLYLMGKLGIQCEYVSSKSLNHAWNIVSLNGKRYHVDLTWDDTRCPGEVEHDNLLRSTNGIKSTNHTANDFDSSPKDTTYDNCYWQKTNTEIQYFNGALYYIDKTTGNIIKRVNNVETVVASVNSKWINAETGGKYSKCYSKLCSDDNYLYFTTPDSVYSIDAGGTVRKAYSPKIPSGLSIYGFSLNDGCFSIYCYKNPNIKDCSQSGCKLTFSNNNADETSAADGIALLNDIGFIDWLVMIFQRIIRAMSLAW